MAGALTAKVIAFIAVLEILSGRFKSLKKRAAKTKYERDDLHHSGNITHTLVLSTRLGTLI